MRKRSALSIQKDVIFAIFVREIVSRFSGYAFGAVWLVLEPLMMMIIFIMIFGARGRGEFGFAEPPVFIMATFLPFRMLWQSTMRKNLNALGEARGLMGFRQVRLFDVFMARALAEAGLFCAVGLLLITGFWWVGFDPWPDNVLEVLAASFILWLFAASFGMLACMASSVAKEVEKVIGIVTMPLLFISAVFFPMTAVPESYMTWLSWNPLVHAVEMIREGWFETYVSPMADPGYLIDWTIVFMALAMATYRLNWRRVIAT